MPLSFGVREAPYLERHLLIRAKFLTFINIDQFCQPNGIKPPRYENEAATARLASLATIELEFEDMNSYASGLQRLVRYILTTVTVVETENEHELRCCSCRS